MSRYGTITVSRWLSEKLPNGMKAYIEIDGALFELVSLQGWNGGFRPTCLTLASSPRRFSPGRTTLKLDTPVILSTSESLAGVKMASIISQIVPAAKGSWALPITGKPRKPVTIKAGVYDTAIGSMFCG